ncbi:MAG: TIGR00725 family protein [Candidatus Micrarchaeota archaeon]|nr:TIGR00725 family protein [Candidatus Micrarchaeota archaeon]
MIRKKIVPQIGVLGPDRSNMPMQRAKRLRVAKIAEAIGRLIAENGAILFSGGGGGVMEDASRGAKLAGGMTVGIPGRARGSSNRYVDIEIVTDQDAGSFIAAGLLSCDALILIPGGSGTMAEMCMAYRNGKRCVVMKGFSRQYDALVGNYLDRTRRIRLLGADTAEEAVGLALSGYGAKNANRLF